MSRFAKLAILTAALAAPAMAQIIYNNGPINTHATGGGPLGADPISALQTNLGLGTYGPTAGGTFRLADDFTVPCGESWTLNSLTVYAYITQAAAPFNTISPFTSANYRIWSGKPGAGGTVIHDFSAANQMTATAWANSYRTLITALTNVQRPIMSLTMAGNGITLGPGTYWLDYQVGPSGFSPYVSILGSTGPANANSIQYIALATTWNNVLTDAGFAQALPFAIDHATAPVSCFTFDIAQAGGPGNPLTLADLGGTPGNTFVNAITLSPQPNFPNGWLFGIDMSIAELTNELSAGVPFTGTLDFAGNFVFGPIGVPPLGVTVYYVGIELSGGTVVRADAAKSIGL